MSLEKSYSLDDEYDDDGYDYRSSSWVFTILLVVLVAWAMSFFYQQELSTNVTFLSL